MSSEIVDGSKNWTNNNCTNRWEYLSVGISLYKQISKLLGNAQNISEIEIFFRLLVLSLRFL